MFFPSAAAEAELRGAVNRLQPVFECTVSEEEKAIYAKECLHHLHHRYDRRHLRLRNSRVRSPRRQNRRRPRQTVLLHSN